MRVNRSVRSLFLKTWIGLFAATVIQCHSPRAWSNTINIKELVEYGLTHSPQIAGSRLQLQAAGLKLANAQATRWPSLNLKASASGLGYATPTPQTDVSNSASVTLSETLYDNGHTTSQIRIAELEKEKAQMLWERQREEFCLEVVKSYLKFLEALEKEKVQEFKSQVLQRHFSIVEKQYRGGEKSKLEYLRFQARLRRNQVEAQILAGEARRNINELTALTGWEGPMSVVDNVGQLAFLSAISDTPMSLDGHIDSKIHLTEKRILDESLQIKRRKLWPELAAEASLTWGLGPSNSQLDPTVPSQWGTSWSALLTFKYPLWDWGITHREVSLAEIQGEIDIKKGEHALLNLRTQLSEIVRDLEERKEEVKLSDDLRKLEQENYENVAHEYRQGRLSFLELIDSVENLASAKVSHLNLLFAYRTRLAEYGFHKGILHEKILQTVYN